MSTQILQRLLNATVTVKRYSTGYSNTGDLTKTKPNVSTTVKMRITRNRSLVTGGDISMGLYDRSSHKAFCNNGVDIQKGDFIMDGSDEYVVDYVDTKPGGTTHHYELYLTYNDKAT